MTKPVNASTKTHNKTLSIPIRRVRGEVDKDLPLPLYMSERAAGMDLVAALDEDITIQPQEAALVPTGLAVAIPPRNNRQ
jgi:dUTP pyrophosphatase